MLTKYCTSCYEEKPSTDFSKNSKGLYGLAQKCKLCSAKITAYYRLKNPYKNASRKYNISEEQVKELWSTTNCMICGIIKKETKLLCIDHCHTTGKIRGVLCDDCNIALGKFKDDPKILMKAINYLTEKYNG